MTVVLLASSSLLLSGCGDYETKLPNGYRLVRTNASSIQIFEPLDAGYRSSPAYRRRDTVNGNATFHDSIVVPPKIVAIGCVGDIVYGIVETSPDSENATLTVPGYFVLDTRTGDVALGLNKESHLKRLNKLGIAHVAPLIRDIRSFRCGQTATNKSAANSSNGSRDSEK